MNPSTPSSSSDEISLPLIRTQHEQTEKGCNDPKKSKNIVKYEERTDQLVGNERKELIPKKEGLAEKSSKTRSKSKPNFKTTSKSDLNPERKTSNPKLIPGRKVTTYDLVVNVREYIPEEKKVAVAEPTTVASYDFGTQQVLSSGLLVNRAKSMRNMEAQKINTMKGAPNRTGTMTGKSKGITQYVDYTTSPEEAPDPIAPHFDLKSINVDDEKQTLTVTLIDGQTTKIFVTKNFTGMDVFQAVINRINLIQFDLFWISRRDDSGDHWVSPSATLSEQGIDIKEPVELKMRWFKSYFKLTDEKTLYYIYLQFSKNFVSSVWAGSNKLLTRLAAIQIQLNYGDFIRAKHKPGFFKKEDLEKFVPQSLLEGSITYLQTRIFSFHRKLTGIKPVDAYKLYIQIARESYYWGVSYYNALGSIGRLGIAEDGFFYKADGEEIWVSYDCLREVKILDDPRALKLDYICKKKGQTIIFPLDQEKLSFLVDHIVGYYNILLQQETTGIRSGTIPKEFRKVENIFFPDYESFMRPKLRIPEDSAPPTMLTIVKQEYLNRCKEAKLTPLNRFMLQVENRMDNEEVLDILDLRGCKIDDNMFQILFQSIDIAINKKMHDEDDQIIEDFVLFFLILDGNFISDGETLGRLLNITKTKKADLTFNKLGTEGAKKLAEQLIENKTLEELILARNNIGEEGFTALMKAIKGSKSFKSFNFETNQLTPNIKTHLTDSLKENTGLVALDLSDNQLGDESILAIFDSLKANKSLEYINITQTNMTHVAGAAIGEFLKSHPHITGFKVGYNKFNTQVGTSIGQVILSNKLVVLDLRFTNIGAAGICGVFEGLMNNKSIIELILNGNPINKKGLAIFMKVLTGNTTLQKLGMRYCDLGKAAFVTLSDVIASNTSITYLDVSHNSLDSSDACKKLAEALGHQKNRKNEKTSQTVISELNLAGCLIGVKQMEEISEGILRNRSLKTLHLDDNQLGIKGMRALGLGIKQHPTLKIITLQDTSITTSDVVGFMEKVSDDCLLDVLDCRKNEGVDASNSAFVQAQRRFNKYKVLV